MSRRNAVYAKHHQERFGVEKRGKNVSGEKDFAGIAPFDVLRRSQEAQTELYQTGDLGLMNEFFAAGGCFLQKVQRQMTIDAGAGTFSPLLGVYSDRAQLHDQKRLAAVYRMLPAKTQFGKAGGGICPQRPFRQGIRRPLRTSPQ